MSSHSSRAHTPQRIAAVAFLKANASRGFPVTSWEIAHELNMTTGNARNFARLLAKREFVYYNDSTDVIIPRDNLPSSLPNRVDSYRDVVRQGVVAGKTLREMGEEIGVCHERVRQLIIRFGLNEPRPARR